MAPPLPGTDTPSNFPMNPVTGEPRAHPRFRSHAHQHPTSLASQGPHLQAPRQQQRSTGSATQTQSNTPDRTPSPTPIVLRLRGAHDASASQRRRGRGIQWAEDVVDNEDLGRKRSKVCCIYHKTRPVGESSSESSSDDSSDSDASDSSGGPARKQTKREASPNAYERMPGQKRGGGAHKMHKHNHQPGHRHGHEHQHGNDEASGT